MTVYHLSSQSVKINLGEKLLSISVKKRTLRLKTTEINAQIYATLRMFQVKYFKVLTTTFNESNIVDMVFQTKAFTGN